MLNILILIISIFLGFWWVADVVKRGGGGGWYMAELLRKWKENKLFKVVFAVTGIMSTLVIYGVLQVKSSLFCIVHYVEAKYIF